MKKEIKKERLPDLFGGLVDAQHYSEYYAKTLKKCLKDYVIPFMEKKGYMYYNLEIGEEFFSAYSQRNKHFAITSRRTVLLLRFYLEEKEYMRQPYKTDYQFPGQIGVLSQQFIEHYCKVNRSSDKTRRIFVQVLSRFSNAMEIRGVTLEMLSHEAVMDYISSLQNTRRYVYSPLRRYLLYLYQNGYTTPNLALSLAGLSEKKGNSLPSVYYSDEIKRIELSVKRDSPVGKRDYAILLLADRLGLRRGDIRNLTMANIDWEKCIISFCQQKTGKYNELPLLEDVGLAILDYFLHGRPKTDVENIFVTANSPVNALSPGTVSYIIGKIIRESGVAIGGRRHSAHSMRHSLATKLMENNTGISVISGILGHGSEEPTMCYLGVSINLLRECSHDVPSVSEEFYNQGGGFFYE